MVTALLGVCYRQTCMYVLRLWSCEQLCMYALFCFGVLLPVGLYAGMFHVAHVSVNACGVLGHGAGVAPSPAPRRLRGGVLPAQTPSEPLSAVALAQLDQADKGFGQKNTRM